MLRCRSSLVGTFLTFEDVRAMVATEAKADILRAASNGRD